MGYYSDVRVSTTRDGYEFLKANCGDEARDYRLFDGYGFVVTLDDERGVVFGWDCVKWYRSFESVSAFLSCLELACEEGYPYEYVCVGEDGAIEWLSSDPDGQPGDSRLAHHIGARTVIDFWDD